MSGTASRYQGRLTYGPGLRVASAYPGMTGAELPEIERSQPTPMPQGQTLARSTGARGAGTVSAPSGDGGSNLLLLAGLGLLPYAGDIFDAASGLFGGGDDLPTPPEFLTEDELIRRGMRDATPGYELGLSGPTPSLDLLRQGGTTGLDPMIAQGIATAEDFAGVTPTNWATQSGMPAGWEMLPTPEGMLDPIDFSSAPGAMAEGGAAAGGGWLSGIRAAIDAANTPMAGATVPQDLGLTGLMGELPMFGDVATGLADIAGGMAGSWMSAQPFRKSTRPYAGMGQQVGSAIGGVIGQAIIPIPVLGAMAGAALGGLAGGGAGSQIGPAPTIGRNFGVTGTFGGDGNIAWGTGGGDNGGTADDANAFANWFGGNLMQRAAAEGLTFNPNMAGVQFNIGGYDQWDRNPNLGGVGGYFYDPYLGGSPERYSLRPTASLPGADLFNALQGPGFTPDQAFGPDQAGAFTNAVLGDLTARGVFTRPGQEAPGRDFYQGTMGMPLGSYTPGMSFADAYGQRQGAVGGWQAGADLRAQQAQGQALALEQMLGAGTGAGLAPGTVYQTGDGSYATAGGMLTPNIYSPGAE